MRATAPKRSRSPDPDDLKQCDFASLLEANKDNRLHPSQEAKLKARDCFEQLFEIAMTCEICYDGELHTGNPRQYQKQLKYPIDLPTFVLCIGFIGPNGEDKSSCIGNIIEYIGGSYSVVQNKRVTSGMTVTRDAHSTHMRMACMPRCCKVMRQLHTLQSTTFPRQPIRRKAWAHDSDDTLASDETTHQRR